jgi:hypothetical protein
MEITFPDSGYTITWPDLPPGALDILVRDAQQAYPKPVLTDAQLADVDTISAAADAHVSQLMDRFAQILDRVTDRIVPVLAQHSAEPIDTEAVKRLRAAMETIGTPLDPEQGDREVFLRHICISSPVDRRALYDVLTTLSPRLRELRSDDPRWHSTEG